MLTDLLILIAFKITLFVLLVIQLSQIIKQYALPFLRNEIAALKENWHNMQSRLELLGATKKRIETSIEKQTETLKMLEDEIKEWHTSLDEKRIIARHEQERLHQILREKKKKQFEYLNLRKTEEKLIPEAMEKAREKLTKMYQEKQGKDLLIKVISELSKKSKSV